MNLTQRHLRMFVTTAAFNHVSRASEALHISQPALTRALQDFESQLGKTLFHRTTRRIALTVEGEAFLPTAQRLLADMEQAVAQVRAGTAVRKQPVTIAVGTAFASTVLPQVLARLASEAPGIQVRLVVDSSAGITARVLRSEVDFGIGSPVGDTGPLLLRRLLSAPIGLLADPARFRLPAAVRAEDLPALPLLKDAADTSIMHMLKAHGSELVARMHEGIEVSCLATQLALARAGVGVAVMSALGASHAQAKGLHFVPLRPRLSREVSILQRRDGPLGDAASTLAAAIAQGVRSAKLHPLVRSSLTPPAPVHP